MESLGYILMYFVQVQLVNIVVIFNVLINDSVCREPFLGRVSGPRQSSRSTRESPRRKCRLPSTSCARELLASLQLTSTTADLSDLKKSQITGNYLASKV